MSKLQLRQYAPVASEHMGTSGFLAHAAVSLQLLRHAISKAADADLEYIVLNHGGGLQIGTTVAIDDCPPTTAMPARALV